MDCWQQEKTELTTAGEEIGRIKKREFLAFLFSVFLNRFFCIVFSMAGCGGYESAEAKGGVNRSCPSSHRQAYKWKLSYESSHLWGSLKLCILVLFSLEWIKQTNESVQQWSACVCSVGKFSSSKKLCKIFSGPESHPNNRESTPPTDNNQENMTNTWEDRNKLAVDKL